MLKKKLDVENLKKMLKIGDFEYFFNVFSAYFFQLFAFLGSQDTEQNFIFLRISLFS